MMNQPYRLFTTAIAMTVSLLVQYASARQLDVLFLGDDGHHRPHERYVQLRPVLADRGIKLDYTQRMADLNAENLQRYDALLVYANIDQIAAAEEKAVLNYVAGGGGFVPLHCASYCFRNSDDLVALMGGQFKRHGTGVFRTEIAEPDHPIMKDFGGFESWDETYVHHLHNEKNRTVLEYRVDDQGREPWTWVRTHGDGRVFYTAWGHDQRTWGNPGFQNLVERGIRWSAGDDPSIAGEFVDRTAFVVPEMTAPREDLKPFEYIDVGAKIPNYTAGARWGTQKEPMTKMQKPLPPEESIKHYSTPVGFELRLFASEPDLVGKPIAMNWDERGRLWVCETYDYPNDLQPSGQGRDRIRICEDTDGDGRADKFTVFAEKLSIPTAIAFHRGGAIVQNGVETLYLKDTDGDDKADIRRVMFSGWTLGDTHGGVSNFQYGLDNWIWAMQGYNNSAPVVNGRRQQAFRMGFFRFRPDGSELEFIRSTDNNTWGLGISEEGIVFGSTANRNPSVHMPVANRYYERVRGWSASQLRSIADTYLFKPITDRVRQVDQHGGYTAGAGHALYTARKYPKQYWNRTAFVCGPTGHLVGTFVLKPNGADFASTSPMNLVASDDEWSAPIMAEVGPDGNVWVLDWYNFIVQHNPTPAGFKTGKGNAYESDLRDKKHGRIYRLVYKQDDNAPEKPFTLADATPEELVAALKHPTFLWRRHAQRLLIERNKTDVVPALVELVLDTSVDEIGLNVGAIHALWTLRGLNAFEGDPGSWGAYGAAISALAHRSAGVRRNAVRVLPRNTKSVNAILDSNVLDDRDSQVRLAAILALADMPENPLAGAAVARLVQQTTTMGDRWLKDAATSAAAAHGLPFLQALVDSESANTTLTLGIATIVAEHLARGKLSGEQTAKLLATIEDADESTAAAVIDGLVNGWPRDHQLALPAAAEQSLVTIVDQIPLGAKGKLTRLASLWGSRELEKYNAEIMASFYAAMTDGKAEAAQRAAAARQLVAFRANDDAVVGKILDQVTPQASPQLVSALLESLADSTAKTAGRQIIDRMPEITPAARGAALRVLLGRPATTRALLEGVADGKVEFSELKLDQKQALATHPDRAIREQAKALLAKGGGLPNPDRDKVLKQLLPLTEKEGDVTLGKAVFKKQCSKCHRHSGEGENIGPDLTGMAVHPKHELLTHIIDPSRSVEGNFRIYTVVTADGRILSGMLAGETRTSIEIIDAEAKRHQIQREDLDELQASRKSLMPEGFEKQVTPDEIVHLLEFLTKRGRFTPLDLRKVATIASDRGMFNRAESDVERLVFPDWSPKTFKNVPFHLTDPKGGTVRNCILLHGPNGPISARMPKEVALPCNGSASAIHLLSGVSGWGFPFGEKGSLAMIVRLHYADGATEDHQLLNGEHFADYIRRVDVPGSEFAFQLRGQQMRYLAIYPKRADVIEQIEFVKGDDRSSPIVMAVTIESSSANDH